MLVKKNWIVLTLSVFAAVCLMLCGVFGGEAKTAHAATNTDGYWTTGKTTDLIPVITSGSLAGQGWGAWDWNQVNANGYYENSTYGFGIRAQDTSDDLGTKSFTGGVYYTINLSDADKVKANLGQLTLYASSINWFQASSHHYISIRAEYYNSSDTLLSTAKSTYDEYYVAQRDYTLELFQNKVPAGTEYIQVWFSNWGSNTGRPLIGKPTCYLYDSTAPSVTGASLEQVNTVDPDNGIVIAGDTIKYYVEFNEKVSISSAGTATITVGANSQTSTAAEVVTENGKSKVGYLFQLGDFAASGKVSFQSVSGLIVLDEANNSYTYNGLPSAGTLQYYKKMTVGKSLSHVTMTGSSSAVYGTDYTAKLTAATGYYLPDSITVTVDGAALAASSYTYLPSDGSLRINGKAIKGDIVVTASGVPVPYTVVYHTNQPDGSSGAISGSMANSSFTYDVESALRKNVYALAGWTFKGWATSPDGSVLYEDGASVKNLTAENRGTVDLYAVWEANTFTVVYFANRPTDASGTPEGSTADSGHTYDTAAPLTENGFSLTGWTFKGWATSADGAVAYADCASVKNLTAEDGGTVNLYAKWEANPYTVMLDSMGGTALGYVIATYDREMPAITVPDKQGYIFNGYYSMTDGGEVFYYDGEGVSVRKYDIDGSLTLYAKWTAIHYTIQFYSGGSYLTEQKDVEYGTMLLPSAESLSLTRENYIFLGWNIYQEQNWAMFYADTVYNTGIAYTDGSVVVLYAAWQEKPIYTLYYDANGGSGAPSARDVHEDESIALDATVPLLQNYTFLGWATAPDATEAVYAAGDAFTMGNSVVTLYAVWKLNPLLSYDANGGNFAAAVSATYVAEGASVAITATRPYRVGYAFAGWAIAPGATEAEYRYGDQFVMPASDTVLYAVWTANYYTVTVIAAAGYGYDGIQESYAYGTAATFTVTGDNPKVYVYGERIYAEGGTYSFTVTEDAVVLVKDASAILLLYSANGGFGAPVDTGDYTPGAEVILSSAEPVKTGYTFLGWATSADAAEAEYLPGGRMILNAPAQSDAVTLYAVWKANTYTVVYHPNGGEGAMEDGTFEYDRSGVLAPNAYAKAGCVFTGWALSADGAVIYGDGAEIKNLLTDGSVTLYAVWKRIETTVYFDPAGGIGGPTVLSVVCGDMLTSNGFGVPVFGGYIFNGYYTADGEMIFDAEMNVSDYYAAAAWDKEVQTLTLYARWTAVSYSVVYVNGQTQLAIQSAVYGREFALYTAEALGIKPVGEARFLGWTTVSGSQNAMFADGQAIPSGLTQEDGDIVYLYAVWITGETEEEKIEALQSEVEEVRNNLKKSVEDLSSALDDRAEDISDLQDKVGQLGEALTEAKDLLAIIEDSYVTHTELQEKLAELKSALEQAIDAAVTSLESEIEAVKTELEEADEALWAAIRDINTDVGALSAALTEFQANYQTAITLIQSNIADLRQADNALSAKIDDLQAATDQATSDLQSAIETVQNNLDDAVEALQNSIDTNAADVAEKLADMEKAYQAADALLDSNLAEMQEELSAKIDDLQAATDQATSDLQTAIDTVQNNLDDAVEALQNSIDNNASDVAEKLAEMEKAYQAADALLDSTLAEMQEELSAKIDDLQAATDQATSDLQAAIDTVQNNLDDAVEALQNSIDNNASDVAEKLAEMEKAYQAADALLDSNLSEMQEELSEKIDDLQAATDQATSDLQAAIDTVQNNLDDAVEALQNSIDTNASDVAEKLAEMEKAYQAADALLDSNLAEMQEELSAKIDDLQAATDQATSDLQAAIDTVQGNLDNAVEALQNSIDTNASDVAEKLAEMEKAYQAADALLDSNLAEMQEELSAKIDDLQSATDQATSDLQTAIDTVQNNLDDAVEALQNSVATNAADVAEKLSALEDARNVAVSLINSDIAALQSADTAISERIARVEVSYQEADAVLQGKIIELQGQLDSLASDYNSTFILFTTLLAVLVVAVSGIIIYLVISAKKRKLS